MSKTLHIHVGAHKTGSTALQKFLWHHREDFAARGLVIPRTGFLDPHWGHHKIAWEVDGREPETGHLGRMLEEIADAPAAVLTAEDIGTAPLERVRLFDGRIRAAGWQPHYIRFHRQPADYAVALHHELNRSREVSFARMLQQGAMEGCYRSPAGLVYWFRPERFAQNWPEPLTTIDYDATRSDVAGAFCRAIGIDPMGTAPQNVNVTPKGRGYRIRRRIAQAIL